MPSPAIFKETFDRIASNSEKEKSKPNLRRIIVVSLQVAIDLDGFQSDDPTNVVSDTIYEVLTTQLQKFNEGKGSLIDWQFEDGEPKVIISFAPVKEEYQEGQAFDRLKRIAEMGLRARPRRRKPSSE